MALALYQQPNITHRDISYVEPEAPFSEKFNKVRFREFQGETRLCIKNPKLKEKKEIRDR